MDIKSNCFKTVLVLFLIGLIPSISYSQNNNPNNNSVGLFWKLDGNNIDTTKFIGTTNNQDLIFKCNNIEGFRIRPNSETKFMGDVILDKFKEVPPINPGPIQEKRVMTINSVGQLALSNFVIPQDDTFVCLMTAPWIFADGTSTDDDIALCPNFKSVTIGGNFTVGGLTRLGVTGIGTSPNPQFQLNLASVNKTAGIRLLNLHTSNSPQRYGIQNLVNRTDIIAYSVTTIGNQDVFRVMGDGQVWATEINVDLASDFPDYVFKPNYTLMPLEELDDYINKNHHLPNIPTANEVKENGLGIAEMQVKQMEKIEELTLYLIELKKEIKVIKKENLELKEMILEK